MPNPNINEHNVRTRFSSEYQPANRGRKPSKLKKWIKENGVSKSDYIAIFNNIIATRTIGELRAMVEGDKKNDLPVIVACCISAFIHDATKGTLVSLNTILDRVMGKPSQTIDATVTAALATETLEKLEGAFREGDGDG
jgi:3-deoxy-D-manno-octulosonate 8-phosphate phosphatase KdsC-like HAD superfamily phosphatase